MPQVAAPLVCATAYVQFIIYGHDGMPAERDQEAIRGRRQGMAVRRALPEHLRQAGADPARWTRTGLSNISRSSIEQNVHPFVCSAERSLSNFPVTDKLMSSYDRLWNAYREIIAPLSTREQQLLR